MNKNKYKISKVKNKFKKLQNRINLFTQPRNVVTKLFDYQTNFNYFNQILVVGTKHFFQCN